MNEYVAYVLYSEQYDRLYIGCSENSISRFYWHNARSAKGFTVIYRPWKMVHIEFFTSKKEAMFREKSLKGGKGREWIRKEIIPTLKAAGFISA